MSQMGQLRDIVATFAPSVVGKDAAPKSEPKAKPDDKEEAKAAAPKVDVKDDEPKTEVIAAVKDDDNKS